MGSPLCTLAEFSQGRRRQARTLEALWTAIGSLLEEFSGSECERYIRHCGYWQSGDSALEMDQGLAAT